MTPGEGISLGVLSDLCRPAFPVGPDSISDQTGKKSYLPVAFTCVVQKCWNDVIKYNRKVRTTFCNFKFWGEWKDSNREIMKVVGWLEIQNFRKIRGEERFQPRPQSLLIGKREDPGDEAEILVPDFTLTANFKMAAQEREFYAPMK